MDELVKAVIAAPLATVFIMAGIIFLLIAVVGNVSGKIEPGARGRVISGALGLAFVIAGVAMHFKEESPAPKPEAVQHEPTRIVEAIQLRCDQYAKEAIMQYQKNLDLVCNYNGARWQNYYENHYRWCLDAPSGAAYAERGARSIDLTRCLNTDRGSR